MKNKKNIVIFTIILIVLIVGAIVIILYFKKVEIKPEKKSIRISEETQKTLEELPSKIILSKDSDGDGIKDEIENKFGTDSQKEDTDNDGITDKKEIIDGTNPLGKGRLTPSMFPDNFIIPDEIIKRQVVSSKKEKEKILETEDVPVSNFMKNTIIVTFHKNTSAEDINQLAEKYDLIVYQKIADLDLYTFILKNNRFADTIKTIKQEGIVKFTTLDMVGIEL